MQTDATDFERDLYELYCEFGKEFSELAFFVTEGEGTITYDMEYKGLKRSFTYDFSYTEKLEVKRYEKRFGKISLYKLLSEYYKKELPWGALTGVRPTKLARQQGENFKEFFTDKMFVSREKTELIGKILNVQKDLIGKEGEYYHLFVSIPLCPTRCAYCSFISCEISKEKRVNEYIEALIKEIGEAKALDKTFKSVYIGGGTPVALKDEDFEKILSAIGYFDGEYTVEAGRPDVITAQKLEIMKRYGVTRVCVNPQTFSNKTLELIGRKHTAGDIIEKYKLVRSFGFDINMDLIAGLPEESFEDFKYSLDTAISLDPENITVHTLALKSGSKLKEKMDRVGDDTVVKMVDYAHKTLQSSGYEPYYLYRQKYMAENLENTGYTKKGKACVYNIEIMEETGNIVACGANAISKAIVAGGKRIERVGAPKDIASYLSRMGEIVETKNKLFR